MRISGVAGLVGLLVLFLPAVAAQGGPPSNDYYVTLQTDKVTVPFNGAIDIPVQITLHMRNLTCAAPVPSAANPTPKSQAQAALTMGRALEIPAWAGAEWVPRSNVTFTIPPGQYPANSPPIRSDDTSYKVRLKWDPYRTPPNATFTYRPSVSDPSDYNTLCITLYPAKRYFPADLTAIAEPVQANVALPAPTAAPTLSAPADASIAAPADATSQISVPAEDSPAPSLVAFLVALGVGLAVLTRRRG